METIRNQNSKLLIWLLLVSSICSLIYLTLNLEQLVDFQVVLPSPGPTPTVIDPSREQYYRGIYDVCVYYGVREHPTEEGGRLVKIACKELIARVIIKKWYENESLDWTWPLEKKRYQ